MSTDLLNQDDVFWAACAAYQAAQDVLADGDDAGWKCMKAEHDRLSRLHKLLVERDCSTLH